MQLTFRLTCATASGDQRAERRYATYTGGTRQFEGYVRISSLSGTRISLKQTFHESGSGPYFMLAVERGGRLYAVHGGDTLSGAGTVGATARVNTVHQVGGSHHTYINGSLAHTTSSPGGSFYDKLGAYRTNSGNGPATVVWSGIRFWRKWAAVTCGSRAVAAAAALLAVAAVAGCSAEKGAVRQAPASPDGARPALRAVLASPIDIDLTWSVGDGDAAGHVLEFATEEGGPYTVRRYFPPGVTAYRHPDLMPRTPFFYRLRAFHGPASGAVGVGLPPGELTGEDETAAHDWLPPRTDAHRWAPRFRPVGDPSAAPAGLTATVKHANGILLPGRTVPRTRTGSCWSHAPARRPDTPPSSLSVPGSTRQD
ncbi:hypothetical protein [Streptomyces sp. NPDC018833]|uniref:hypothetical protein n=1 Tax=Streptomyces sp. NPDC018833 TaxID=3365053 RepID=UPI003793DF0C